MARAVRIGDLEIDQDEKFQQRYWRIQRVAWAVLLCAVALGMAGFFGNGPISRGQVQSGDLKVEYSRFARQMAGNTVRIMVPARAAKSGSLRLWLGREYLQRMDVQRVVPFPQAVEVSPDWIGYTFQISSQEGELTINFDLEPQEFGRLRGLVAVDGGPSAQFRQTVYP